MWTNFRVLSTDSSGFREWSTKFKNAFGQARPGRDGLTYKRVIEKLERMAGQWMSDPGRVEEQMRDQIDETKMNDVMQGLSLPGMTKDKWAGICEDIYAVLLDKTEGELHRKVVNQGDKSATGMQCDGGAKAYLQVYMWFMETTGLKLSERRSALMTPSRARNEDEIADAIESWEREELEIRKLDPSGSDLPDVWKMTALKCLLTGRIKEHIELRAAQFKGYDDLRSEVMKYATQKRLEKNRSGNMSIDNADRGERDDAAASEVGTAVCTWDEWTGWWVPKSEQGTEKKQEWSVEGSEGDTNAVYKGGNSKGKR